MLGFKADCQDKLAGRLACRSMCWAALAAFVFCLGVVLNICTSNVNRRILVIDSRVNPNTAPAAALEVIDGIGPAKAAAVIEYRQSFASSEKPAFETPEDLQKVKGIGPKTVEKMRPYLKFNTN